MGALADWQIRKEVKIVPFEENLRRPGVLSYGVSSYGYDVRVGRTFKLFTNVYGAVVDPKNFAPNSFVDIVADHCIIPPNSFALAETVEYLEIPRDIICVCLGKSTYARCFTGDTRVALVDGSSTTLEEMARRAEAGEMFFGYSIGAHGQLMVTHLEAPRLVGRDGVIEVVLDNGEGIRCTPDHQFLLRDGRLAEANDLRPGTSLMPLYRQPIRGYEVVYAPLTGHLIPTHRMADAWNLRHGLYEDDGSRRERQAEVAHAINLLAETAEAVAHAALHETGSIRGAPRLLDCDHSVFRRFPGLLDSVRGRKPARNLKVAAIRAVPGLHDVYCLTVPEAGNFALEAGVFVKNCGIFVNVTPLEPEWRGKITIEISNTTPLPAKIYANEGIAQILFFRADAAPCETSYADKKGKYQDQPGLVPPMILGQRPPG